MNGEGFGKSPLNIGRITSQCIESTIADWLDGVNINWNHFIIIYEFMPCLKGWPEVISCS